jgi:hypothetical protein
VSSPVQSGRLAAILFLVLLCSCRSAGPTSTRSPRAIGQVTEIPLSGSQYIYDVAVVDGLVWVTSQGGLFRIDPATRVVENALVNDYLYKIAHGHGSLWISTGEMGRVLRVDPVSAVVTAEIDLREGSVTDLAVTDGAVWASAGSELARIDPQTNDVVARIRHDDGFGDIAVAAGAVWVVAGAEEDGAVWRVDPVTGDVRQQIPLENPHFWNQIDAQDGMVWVTSSPIAHRDDVPLVHLYGIDPMTGAIVADVPLGEGASGLQSGEGATSLTTLAIGAGSVWVAEGFDGDVFRIDPGTRRVIDVLHLGVDSGGDVGSIAVGAGAVWITVPEAVARMELIEQWAE